MNFTASFALTAQGKQVEALGCSRGIQQKDMEKEIPDDQKGPRMPRWWNQMILTVHCSIPSDIKEALKTSTVFFFLQRHETVPAVRLDEWPVYELNRFQLTHAVEPTPTRKFNLTMCAAVNFHYTAGGYGQGKGAKDSDSLEQWILYHILMGVEHIFICKSNRFSLRTFQLFNQMMQI
jgi:hypothetical protein